MQRPDKAQRQSEKRRVRKTLQSIIQTIEHETKQSDKHKQKEQPTQTDSNQSTATKRLGLFKKSPSYKTQQQDEKADSRKNRIGNRT